MEKRIFLSPPHMGGEELGFVKEAFKSNYVAPIGPMIDAFEKEFAEKVGVSHALALSSGTAAIHLALNNLGVGPEDEVFASTLTFIGSVSPITFLGATPVFIDSDRQTWNMAPDLLEQELSSCAEKGKLPKAVIPTDLYGQCADVDRIKAVCEPFNIPIIVDSAEALGATYKGTHAGTGAKAAIFSFNGNKIITTSGGGMLVSEDKEFIDHARFLSTQARDPFSHYEHSEIGYNYRMSNIVAAIGRGQLRVLNERVKVKREIFDYYRKALGETPGIEFMPEASYGQSTRWLTVILISPEEFGADRETIRLALEAENIEARPVWKPMHLQPVFNSKDQGEQLYDRQYPKKRYKVRTVGGGVAADLFNKGLCLPSGTAMRDKDLDRVISVILKCRG